MLKGSILAYILAGTLAVTAVTVGVTVAVNNQNEKAAETESMLAEFETDAKGNYIGPDGSTYSADEILESVKEGTIDISGNSKSGSENSKMTETTDSSTEVEETEAPTEVAKDEIEIEGTTIEGVLGVDVIDDSEMVIEYSADDYRYADTSDSTKKETEKQETKASIEKETKEQETEAAEEETTTEEETENASEIAKQQELAKYEEINDKMAAIQESIRESKAKERESVAAIEEGEGGGQ